MTWCNVYLCKVQVILLHVHQMVPDQKLHCLYVVFVLITTLNQTPATNAANNVMEGGHLSSSSLKCNLCQG